MEFNAFTSWLKENNMSPRAFSMWSRISYNTILKICRGEQIRKDIAKRVVKHTKKKLRMEDFGYSS